VVAGATADRQYDVSLPAALLLRSILLRSHVFAGVFLRFEVGLLVLKWSGPSPTRLF
jgi:hypothetical protein